MGGVFIVHGGVGTGAVAVEAALTLMDAPYTVEDVRLGDRDAAERFAAVNPMRQVPALVLPSGELLTESAAILTWLAESRPDTGLSPPPGSPRRHAFLRWMAFVSSAVYALFWIRDDPTRLAVDPAHQALMRTRIDERLAACWASMERQITPGSYLLGEELSVLDLYVTVISRWEPHRKLFYRAAPRMGEVVRRVDVDPRLADLWARRFPFVDGWEG